ncbi:MAG TPA: LysM peptidoglycan-binding domain-containing protein [Acidimicrobiales bacterium]|nr:LysM peptidoglycan-binding domain-containing protein [Acidimicrobiales bacterium]
MAALVAVAGIAIAGTAATGSYTVRPGETLSHVAAAHDVSVAELAEANGIGDPNRLPAGQKLVIPKRGDGKGGGGKAGDGKGDGNRGDKGSDAKAGGAKEERRPVTADAATPRSKGGDAGPGGDTFHIVAPGESLSVIAARYGTTVRALAEANGVADVNRIVVGQRLAMPGSGEVSTPAGPAGDVDTSRFPAILRASPDRMALVPRFEHWAAVSRVPLDLFMAMTWLESGWQDDVISSAGAIGIGQLMPDTARWMSDTVLRVPLDPHKADDNIRMSAAYLRWLLDRTGGDPAAALAGYYQGLGAVQSVGVFPSTKVYVANVLAFRDRYF